jgi:hypothetical protein
VHRLAAANPREAAIEVPHARLDVAAMMGAKRQHASRHAVLSGAPDVATLRAASVDGGVTP